MKIALNTYTIQLSYYNSSVVLSFPITILTVALLSLNRELDTQGGQYSKSEEYNDSSYIQRTACSCISVIGLYISQWLSTVLPRVHNNRVHLYYYELLVLLATRY